MIKRILTEEDLKGSGSTIVIANYDSHSNSKKNADIIINKGENASKKINDAIQSLKSTGGEVKLMEGIYNLEYGIAINVDNVHLTGVPSATILTQSNNWSANPFVENNSQNIVETWRKVNTNKINVEISNLTIKANISFFSSFNCLGNTRVRNCKSSHLGGFSFVCQDNSYISNCISYDSTAGFSCSGDSTVINCISYNGEQGFLCNENSKITNCLSKNSTEFGFWCFSTFTGVCSFNTMIGDNLKNSSNLSPIIEYNISKI